MFMCYRLSNSLSSSNTHILFPPHSLTAACGEVECQHLISSFSLCLSSPSQGRVSCTGRMMVQAVNQRGRSQRSTPGHMRRWGFTDWREKERRQMKSLSQYFILKLELLAGKCATGCSPSAWLLCSLTLRSDLQVCYSDVKCSKKLPFTQVFAVSWITVFPLLNCPFRKEKLCVNEREHLFALFCFSLL